MWRLVFGAAVLLSGCSLKRYLPEGPVLTSWERTRGWPGHGAAQVRYTGAPSVPYPVAPLSVWGLAYEVDLVLVTKHPSWDMHEYARIDTPDGKLWLCKDARAGSLDQTIVADLPDIDAWMPEVPVPRKSWPVKVVDRSTDGALDLELTYENLDGEPVHVTYAGPPPRTLQKKRNGSTMGHSRNTVLAVLDLSYRDLGKRATVEIGGEAQRLDRILGLLPFKMVLEQTQGGLAVADVLFQPAEDGLASTYQTASGGEVSVPWTVREEADAVELIQASDIRTLTYRFTRSADGAGLELASAWVNQHGRPTPTVAVHLAPPLADLRRPFEGTSRSRFVLDVNGQQSHAVGWLEARSTADGAVVDVIPEAPWWTTDRPLRATVATHADVARVLIERVPLPQEP